jgi:hypothetical protein
MADGMLLKSTQCNADAAVTLKPDAFCVLFFASGLLPMFVDALLRYR